LLPVMANCHGSLCWVNAAQFRTRYGNVTTASIGRQVVRGVLGALFGGKR
jgi:hypothetical protein